MKFAIWSLVEPSKLAGCNKPSFVGCANLFVAFGFKQQRDFIKTLMSVKK
jgi:hypothetical protein